MIRYAQSRRTKVSCLTWWPGPSHLSPLLHWHCSRSLQLRQDGLEEQKDWVYFADELGEYVDASRKGISVAVVGLKVTVISSLSSLLPILDSSHSRLEPEESSVETYHNSTSFLIASGVVPQSTPAVNLLQTNFYLRIVFQGIWPTNSLT